MRLSPLAHLPHALWSILREATRHVLRHPVVGVSAVARVADGRWLLVRRGDLGSWGLPGGTLEWGETLTDALRREIAEETGAELVSIGRLIGVFSRPDRDPRFHAVTVAVECEVNAPVRMPQNPLEILEVALFSDADLPSTLAFGARDMVDAARRGAQPILE